MSIWSEEDEKMLADAYIMLDWYKGNNWWKAQYIKAWLKSLKDRVQPQWKPSEEQMKQLKNAADIYPESRLCYGLKSLYEELKKLKQE